MGSTAQYVDLPPGVCGYYDHETGNIYVDKRMPNRSQRCTFEHELTHKLLGHGPATSLVQRLQREIAVERLTARRLIPFSAFLSAMTRFTNAADIADALDVDEDLFYARVFSPHRGRTNDLRGLRTVLYWCWHGRSATARTSTDQATPQTRPRTSCLNLVTLYPNIGRLCCNNPNEQRILMSAIQTIAGVLRSHWSASTHTDSKPFVDRCDGCGEVIFSWGDPTVDDGHERLAAHQATALAAAGYRRAVAT